jgi:hypothetical protein
MVRGHWQDDGSSGHGRGARTPRPASRRPGARSGRAGLWTRGPDSELARAFGCRAPWGAGCLEGGGGGAGRGGRPTPATPSARAHSAAIPRSSTPRSPAPPPPGAPTPPPPGMAPRVTPPPPPPPLLLSAASGGGGGRAARSSFPVAVTGSAGSGTNLRPHRARVGAVGGRGCLRRGEWLQGHPLCGRLVRGHPPLAPQPQRRLPTLSPPAPRVTRGQL